MSGGGPPVVRSMRRLDDVRGQKVAKGTAWRVLKFATPYKKLLFWFLALVIMSAIIGAVYPLLYREIINKGIVNGDITLIVVLTCLSILLAIVDTILSYREVLISSRIGEGLVYDMRTKIFEHIQKMSLSFFTKTQTGKLVSRLNNDVRGAQEAFTDVLSTVVGNLFAVIMVLIAMFFLSWQLTLVALILLPAFILPARWLGRRLQSAMREQYDLSADMNTIMVERFNVAGALLVKLFGRPKDENQAFGDKAGRVRDISIKQNLYARVFRMSLMFITSIAAALVYGLGGILTAKELLDIGTLVALTAYLGRLYGPLTSLSNIRVDITSALISFERVFEVLDLKPTITEKPSSIKISRGPASIEFEHVNFSYHNAKESLLASTQLKSKTGKKTDVLFDISFKANPGELVALVGPSGSGKTTISQLVPRLYDVDEGTVKINGVDVKDATLSSLSSVVGVVTQDSHMFHDTIRANLVYAKPNATEKEIQDVLQAAQISSAIKKLPDGIDTVVGERGYQLSGGEKQRLAVARLLLKSPDIVVLDEATAHLDSESEKALQKALNIMLKGRTSIVIAHRLSTILHADKILVIKNGRIVEQGKHDALLKNQGLYSELYNTQFSSKKS